MRELTWKIETLNVEPEYEGRHQVVRSVHWRASSVEDDRVATTYGEVVLDYDGAEEFTPYPDLSPEQVLDWVKKCLGEKGLANIEAEIDRQLAAPVLHLMPWENLE